MAPPKRYSAPTNTIKLTFDFDTLDRLNTRAKERKVDATRCAYELIQEALGVRPQAGVDPAPAPEPDEVHQRVMRGIEQIRNQKPEGNR